MVKVKTKNQRNLPRSKRLRKKLHLGEFARTYYCVTASVKPDGNVGKEPNCELLMQYSDDVYDRLLDASLFATMGLSLEEGLIKLDISVDVPSSTPFEDVIALIESFEEFQEIKITNGVDVWYGEVWDLEDPFDIEHWEIKYQSRH